MATGYTSGITETTTFEAFALRCARAFGATVSMRDDPLGAAIPDKFEPSRYYADAIETTRARIRELEAMTATGVEAAILAEAKADREYREKRRAEWTTLRANYERMLASAVAWKPPTPDHVEMRKFMIQQLQESIEWDCTIREEPLMPAPTLDDWRQAKLAVAHRELSYNEAEYAKDIERAANRTKWVADLRASLSATA